MAKNEINMKQRQNIIPPGWANYEATVEKNESAHLAEVVKVVFVPDPLVRRVRFADAVGLIVDVTDVRTLAVVERTFEQLSTKHTTAAVNSSKQLHDSDCFIKIDSAITF